MKFLHGLFVCVMERALGVCLAADLFTLDIYTDIYICVCVCVCVCIQRAFEQFEPLKNPKSLTTIK